IGARITALEKPCRDTLAAAACLGDPFTLELVSALTGASPEATAAQLEQALAEQLVVADGQRHRFSHPLVRQACYAPLLPGARQRLHMAAAEVLLARHGVRAAEHAVEIAHHVVAAGPTAPREQVVGWARRAGHQAYARASWSDAARYFQAALDAASGTRLL